MVCVGVCRCVHAQHTHAKSHTHVLMITMPMPKPTSMSSRSNVLYIPYNQEQTPTPMHHAGSMPLPCLCPCTMLAACPCLCLCPALLEIASRKLLAESNFEMNQLPGNCLQRASLKCMVRTIPTPAPRQPEVEYVTTVQSLLQWQWTSQFAM